MVVCRMVCSSFKEGGGAAPVADDVLETVFKEREVSALIQTSLEHDLRRLGMMWGGGHLGRCNHGTA